MLQVSEADVQPSSWGVCSPADEHVAVVAGIKTGEEKNDTP